MPHVIGKIVAPLVALCVTSGVFAANIEQQRAAFIDAWPSALKGEAPDPAMLALLKDYPLLPDLKAAVFSATLDTADRTALNAFMQRYAHLAPIRRLRYRYANHLGVNKDWSAYLPLYEQFYADESLPALDCMALQGYLDQRKPFESLARRLWLVGHSQHDYCDTPFANLRQRGVITPDWIRQRTQLAIDARKLGLASYLAKMLDDPAAEQKVAQWRQAYHSPRKVLASPDQYSSGQLVVATRRLALSDAPAASMAFRQLDRDAKFDDRQRGETLRYIAIAGAQDYEPEAADFYDAVPDGHRDARVTEWRIRTALREYQWLDVISYIGQLPSDLQASDRWRYWEARALIASGQRDAGIALMARLAAERSFYGFLAADFSGSEYRFDPLALKADETVLARLQADPAIQRARELLFVGQRSRAASEWRRALRTRPDEIKKQAAILAHRWQWHRESIALLGELALWDDLDIRYPLTYEQTVRRYSRQHGVEDSFAFGILRSESLYDPQARSSAGAIGLMQLIPSTGKRMAQRTGTRWRGTDMLKDAESNIRFGTRYLSDLLDRFDHPALVAAAYNAGPHRIDRWLPRTNALPADIWIETIAYDETRAYVQRVLAASTVFRWRLGEPKRRLSDALPPVAPKQRVASAQSRL